MSTEFKREERYIVVKLKHLREAQGGRFPDNKIDGLLNYLSATGVDPLEGAMVIEGDWPEYEPAWAMIEARVNGLKARDCALREELAQVCHERDLLAKAIGDAAQKAGITGEGVALTGPMLLMLADDLAEFCIARAVNAECEVTS
ncbi:hypothetical protein Pfra02_04340 [Pseudomonas fragi]|nr:hypothetical protein Pfra02_04340 [Pseudomonas fragi]